MPVCSQCGTSVDGRVCVNCGSQIEEESRSLDPSEPALPPDHSDERKSHAPRYVDIAIGILACLLFGTIALLSVEQWGNRNALGSAPAPPASPSQGTPKNAPASTGSQSQGTPVNLVATDGFWMGQTGKGLFPVSASGTEVETTEVAIFADDNGKLYIANPDELPRKYPLDLGIWQSLYPNHYLVVEGMGYQEWADGVASHPKAQWTYVVWTLCKERIPVYTFEHVGLVDAGEDIPLRSACTVFHDLKSFDLERLGDTNAGPTSSAETGGSAVGSDDATRVLGALQPREILQRCRLAPGARPITVALDGSVPDEISLYDCRPEGPFVIVSEKQRNTVCSLDFTLSDVTDFKITQEASGVRIATSVLAGSSGEVNPWIVQLSKNNGVFSAILEEGGPFEPGRNPVVRCEGE